MTDSRRFRVRLHEAAERAAPAPIDLWPAIEARLAPRAASHPRRRGWLAIGAALAAVSAIVVAALLLARGDGDGLRVASLHQVTPTVSPQAVVPTPTPTAAPQEETCETFLMTQDTHVPLYRDPDGELDVLAWLGADQLAAASSPSGTRQVADETWYRIEATSADGDTLEGWVRKGDFFIVQRCQPTPAVPDCSSVLFTRSGDTPLYGEPDSAAVPLLMVRFDQELGLPLETRHMEDETWHRVAVQEWSGGPLREGWVRARQVYERVICTPAPTGEQRAHLIVGRAHVRAEPSQSAPALALLGVYGPSTMEVVGQTTVDGELWYEVTTRTASGRVQGWIHSQYVRLDTLWFIGEAPVPAEMLAPNPAVVCNAYPHFCVPFAGGAVTLPVSQIETPANARAAIMQPRPGRVVRGVTADNVPVIGSPGAPLTLEVVMAFDCPHCLDYWDEVLVPFVQSSVMNAYAQLSLRLVAAPDARYDELAGQAALCAGQQGAFWELVDLLVESSRARDLGAFGEEDWITELDDHAAALVLDRDALVRCIFEERFRATLDDYRDGVDVLGVQAMPTVLRYDPASGEWSSLGLPKLTDLAALVAEMGRPAAP